MIHILVIHGPNLNMLGKRDTRTYGNYTLEDINTLIQKTAKEHDVTVSFFQSNHEGVLIDTIQQESSHADGILINPGALTHYGYALRDALADTHLPIVEVHLSNIMEREEFRKIDVLDGIVVERIMGKKEMSYTQGLSHLIGHILEKKRHA